MEESERSAMSQTQGYLEAIKNYLRSPDLTLISGPKPWLAEFVNIRKFSIPKKQEFFNRAKENFVYFLPNYLAVFITVLVVGVLSVPSYLISLMVLAGVWVYLYSIKELVLSGKEITPFHKNLVIGIGVILVTVLLAWEIVFYSCVFVFAGCMAHAGCHEVPEDVSPYLAAEISI